MAGSRRRHTQSRFGVQLEEKRNLKKIFGIRERQLRIYFKEALNARDKETGGYLVELLERRLDNALFRAGFALTRAQARQMAGHKIVEINGRVVSVPSYRLSENDVVLVREKKRKKALFSNFEKKMQNAQMPQWLELDESKFGFKVKGKPTYEESKIAVDTQAVVELLSR